MTFKKLITVVFKKFAGIKEKPTLSAAGEQDEKVICSYFFLKRR